MWDLRLHAFSLMPNHYHLLIETPAGNLLRAMRHLNHVYTQRFNCLTGRDGHLFRGRYKSILVEDEAYLVELIRYIHLNPVKSGLAKRPEQHAWSSHRYYMSENVEGKALEFLTTERILNYFGNRRHVARRKLYEFLMQGVPENLERRLSAERWPSVLSSDNFEAWIQWNFVKDLKDDQVRYVPARHKVVSEHALRKALCRALGVSRAELTQPEGRKAQQMRAQAIWCYRHFLKMGYSELAGLFGVGASRITRIMKQEGLVGADFLEMISVSLGDSSRKVKSKDLTP